MTFPTIGPSEAREYIRIGRTATNDVSAQLKTLTHAMTQKQIALAKIDVKREVNNFHEPKAIASTIGLSQKTVRRLLEILGYRKAYISDSEYAQIQQQRKAAA